MKRLLVLDEAGSAGRFDPLTLTRPAFHLRDGAFTNIERWTALLKPDSVVHRGKGLADSTTDRTRGDDVWTVEGIVQPTVDVRWSALRFPASFHWTSGNGTIKRSGYSKSKESELPSSVDDFPARSLAGLWSLIEHLGAQLTFDFALWRRAHKSPARKVHSPTKGVFVTGNSTQLWVGKNVRIAAQNVLNLESGPIILDDGVTLEPFNRIDGPAYIGKGTTLLGGKFTGGTAIGPGCKIGGEWECSIAQGFVNKAHAGFFGHGMLGEWVNLGAMTTNSDLKSTYGIVRMRQGEQDVETGQIKVGSFIADHTKTGIGTLIPTGATWGVGCNVFGGGMGPKYLPSFMWGGQGGWSEHRLDRMLSTAEAAIARRSELLRELGEPDNLSSERRDLLTGLFKRDADARVSFIKSAHW